MNVLDTEQLENCYKIARKIALRLKTKDMLAWEPAKAMFVFSAIVNLIDIENPDELKEYQDFETLSRFHSMCNKMKIFRQDISCKKISRVVVEAYYDAVHEIIDKECKDDE